MDSFSVKIIVGFCLISLLVILQQVERLMWWRFTNLHFSILSPVLFHKTWAMPKYQFDKWLNETVIPNDKLEVRVSLDNGVIFFRPRIVWLFVQTTGRFFDFAGKITITEDAGNNSISLMYRVQPFSLLLYILYFLLLQIMLLLPLLSDFTIFPQIVLFEVFFMGVPLALFFSEKRRFHDFVLQMIPTV